MRPLFAKSTLVQNWLTSGEALAIYNLIIDQNTQQPTQNGAIWLKEANIKAEEIYMFNRQELTPVRTRGKSQSLKGG